MQTTTYQCDRCKNVVGHGDLIVYKIVAQSWNQDKHRVEICRPCSVALGLHDPREHLGEKAPDPAPDVWSVLEQLIAMLRERGLLLEGE